MRQISNRRVQRSQLRTQSYKLIVRSKNHSCSSLRNICVPCRTILRLGSTTPTSVIDKGRGKTYFEINSPEACKISGNKILMKQKFINAGVKTAEYFTLNNRYSLVSVKRYFNRFGTIIAKKKDSCKGNGIYLLENFNDFKTFAVGKDVTQFVFEKYYNYNKEYRLHISKNGCFYTCRKMLKRDAIDRWHRHDSNSIWVLEENPQFNKPNNWDLIVSDCVKALNAVGLDIGAFDVKCETNTPNPDWIILESNSAPALGELGVQKYEQEIKRLCSQISAV